MTCHLRALHEGIRHGNLRRGQSITGDEDVEHNCHRWGKNRIGAINPTGPAIVEREFEFIPFHT